MSADDFKIVEVTMLVRKGDAEDLHETYGRFTEHDELSLGAAITTRELTLHEKLDWQETIEGTEEWEADQ